MTNILSDDVIKAFKEAGEEDELMVLGEHIKFHSDNYIKKSKFRGKSIGYIRHNCFMYMQSSLYRSKSYTDGYIYSLNSNNPLLAVLSARAHLEIACSLGYLFSKLQNFYTDKTLDKIEITDIINKLILGTKDKKRFEEKIKLEHDAINVLTMIDTADKALKKLTAQEFKIRNIYNEFSEFCHPNSFGLVLATDLTNSEEEIFRSSSDEYEVGMFLLFHRNFLLSCHCLELFYIAIRGLVVLNGKLELDRLRSNNP